MEKLDKVIAGLGCCADLDRSCQDCPYDGAEYCEVALMQDALVVIGALRIAVTAAEVLERYRPAFEALAKGEEVAVANKKRVATCGDCIHADVCKQVNGGWFSRENIAYCKGFKDRTSYVEVVRCKDCKHYVLRALACRHENFNGIINMNGFCSYGERRTDGSA